MLFHSLYIHRGTVKCHHPAQSMYSNKSGSMSIKGPSTSNKKGCRQLRPQPLAAVSTISCKQNVNLAAADNTSRQKLRLILLRHAHSLQGADVGDHQRPITDTGRQAAEQVADLLRRSGWLPQLIICSNALRTKQTVEAMQESVSELKSVPEQYIASLYTVAALDGQTKRHLADCIMKFAADGVSCVMCVGHNKGWEEAATALAGTPVRLKTACAALLEADCADWQQAFANMTSWRLVDVLVPAEAV